MKSKFIMRTKSDEPETAANNILPLSEISTNLIAKNFQSYNNLKAIPESQKEKIFAKIDLQTADIEVLSRTVDNEALWLRACNVFFNFNESALLNECRLAPIPKTPKQKFFELYLQKKLCHPDVDLAYLKKLANAFGPFISELRVEKISAALPENFFEIMEPFQKIQGLLVNLSSKSGAGQQDPWRGITLSGAETLFRHANLQHLQYLKLENNLIDADVLKIVLRCIKKSTKLQKISLAHNNLGDEGVLRVCKFLIKHPLKLELLDLSDCELGYEAGRLLAELLSRPDTHIENLKLNMNFINSNACEKIFENIAENPAAKLKTLDLSSNLVNRDVSGSLIQLMELQSCALKEILLDGNELNFAVSSVRKLRTAMANLKYELKISLSFSSLTTEQLEFLKTGKE